MNQVKHILFVHLFPWISSAVRDGKAWVTGFLAAATAAGHDLLTGMDVTQAMNWTRKEWALHVLKIVGGGVLGWLVMGRPHQSAEDMIAKLNALAPAQRAALLVGSDTPGSPAPVLLSSPSPNPPPMS